MMFGENSRPLTSLHLKLWLNNLNPFLKNLIHGILYNVYVLFHGDFSQNIDKTISKNINVWTHQM